MKKLLTYGEAINSGLDFCLKNLDSTIIIGQGVDSVDGVFGTTKNLVNNYGKKRVLDFPISESLMTSASIGMANKGLRPVLVHQRIDFMMYSLDALINWMSIWRFKSGGESKLPIVIRALIGRGWGQGPQHSKPLYSMLTGIPGLKVVMPTTPYDAKGLIISSVLSNDPVLFIEHRSLYNLKEELPSKNYSINLNHERLRKKGNKLTIICLGDASLSVLNVIEENKYLSGKIEVIDLVSLNPLNLKKSINSIKKNKNFLIIESCWFSMALAHRIISIILNKINSIGIKLKKFPSIYTLPDSHTPASSMLEKKYYLNEKDILRKIEKQIR
ncbi:hypothetical protein N8863_03335 [Candidatus Pelagibacter ubique]|jgi:acetoin:2,6-dichlorophenolindophenol oxidoreductase subunit beta|nr:hypothetical protein [Candidatus Pelagibacter ubique]